MKNLLIISNWKLNGNKNFITNTLTTLTKKLINISKCHIVIAPPLVYLDSTKNYLLHMNSHIQLCAQNVDTHLSGAFTGDISALMLKDIGVEYVLIGHSERRIHHKETNFDIAEKFSILKKIGITPILCIGENKTEHDSGITTSVCINQIESIIKLLGVQSFQNSIIAYEPIWAIGNNTNTSPENIQLIHKSIRNHIAGYNQTIAKQLLIQYGGSVNSNNVVQLIKQNDIDGVLIGSASLDIDHFIMIIELIENYINKKYVKQH